MNERCPFDRPIGRPQPALVNCPEVKDPCPCVSELLRHALGEVDAQTIDVVAFWMLLDPMPCDPRHRELLPKYRRIQDE